MAKVEEKVTYCRICEPLCGMVATVEDGNRDLVRRLEVRWAEAIDGDVGAGRANGSGGGKRAAADQSHAKVATLAGRRRGHRRRGAV